MLAVARHEMRRLVPRRRGLPAAAAALVLLAGAAWLAADAGVDPDDDLYPIAVDGDSPLRPAIERDGRFAVQAGSPSDVPGRLALWVGPDGVVHVPDDRRSAAAFEALREAVRSWLEDSLGREEDRAAAFPLAVNILEEPRSEVGPAPTSPAGDGGTPGGGLVGQVAEGSQVRTGLRPSEVEPPFPVRSLLLAFAYLIPMNFVAQAAAGSLLGERIRHRGLLLLSAPVRGPQVLAGKVLPYAAASAAVAVVATVAIGAGWTGFAAAVPIVGFVLAAAVLVGLLARSERELTFLLTGVTTAFATFLFLPAVFTSLPPVAYLSPVTVVSAGIRGESVPWGAFAYATVPTAMVAAGLALLARGLYRDETLHSQLGLWAKATEGLAWALRARGSRLVAGALAVPFAMALELFVLAIVLPLGLLVAFPAFVLGTALVEEALKAWLAGAATRRGGRRPVRLGLAIGTGFFLGEKLALLVALTGMAGLPLGDETLQLFGLQGGVLLLALPLLLHTSAAVVGATGAGRGRGWAVLAWVAAAAVHAAYNVLVVLGGAA